MIACKQRSKATKKMHPEFKSSSPPIKYLIKANAKYETLRAELSFSVLHYAFFGRARIEQTGAKLLYVLENRVM